MAVSFVQRWLNRAKASAREEIQETARSALAYVVAVFALLMAIVFLTLAAFWWLEDALSAVAAALIITAFYASVAAVVLIRASWSSHPQSTQAVSEQAPPEEAEALTGDMPSNLGVDLGGVARMLADSGFRTESLIVSASSEVTRQLTPLQFVGLVFVASFLFGRRLRR